MVISLCMLSTCVFCNTCHTLNCSFDDDDGGGGKDGKRALQTFQMDCKKFDNLKNGAKLHDYNILRNEVRALTQSFMLY